MSEEHNEHTNLSKSDRALLNEIHHALVGDPLNSDKPGLVATVGRHERTLYGTSGKNGLAGDNRKFWKIVWIGTGAFFVLQGFWAWILAVKASGK